MEERREEATTRITSLPTVSSWSLIQCDFKRRHIKYASELSIQGTKEKVFVHQILTPLVKDRLMGINSPTFLVHLHECPGYPCSIGQAFWQEQSSKMSQSKVMSGCTRVKLSKGSVNWFLWQWLEEGAGQIESKVAHKRCQIHWGRPVLTLLASRLVSSQDAQRGGG